jgi:hypothetical protein
MAKLKTVSPLLLIGILMAGILIGSLTTMIIARVTQPLPNPDSSPTSGIPQSCTYKNQTYQHGETFMDDCNTCNCEYGQVGCTLMGCE